MMLDVVAAKTGLFAIGAMFAQEVAGVDLSNLPGYGIIGAAMLWAWRTIQKTQADAFTTTSEAHEKAITQYEEIIATLQAENQRLRDQRDN